MRQTLFILALPALLISCGPDGRNTMLGNERIDSLEVKQQTGAPALPDTTTFPDAFNRFFNALQAADTAALNGFVAAGQGFWLIEQPGAIPAYSHFSSVQEAQRKYQQLPFTSINQQVKQCDLRQREEFPAFDCAAMDGGATGFAEDGCFYTFNASDFQNTTMSQYAELSKQQEEQVQKLQKQVQATVLHTGSSFRFHFGYHNGRWLLLFADLRMPCSA